MQNQNYKEAIKSDIFSIITRASEILEVKSYVIGGFVRDYISMMSLKVEVGPLLLVVY